MKIIPTNFLHDLEVQMKDVYAAQNLQNVNINAYAAQATKEAARTSKKNDGRDENKRTDAKTLMKRLSMQKEQAWALRERMSSQRTVAKITGDYDGEFV